ncbi:MAG TPA: hypothetical protein VHC70_00255 [Phycisphaerales bacterium]|nr:hypothetical protein [Phycisphaerales bacterium]
MASITTSTTRSDVSPSPLWAVLSLTFLCSIGSAVIYGGVFFLAKDHYGFGQTGNFLLALLFGVLYIPAAFGAGAMQRGLRDRGVSPRAILTAMMLVMGAICFFPWLAERAAAGSSSRSAWPIWLVIAVYAPVSGMMWPLIESFLAGGRTEQQLRAAIGKFNVAWSSAIALTFFAMAVLISSHALLLLALLGVVHLMAIGIVLRFPPAPAPHPHHEHHERPLIYRQLLAFLRIMLPVSFMFISTLSPYMPAALDKLRVPLLWQTPLTATWYSTRVLTFLAMERRHGWHGRWTVPILGSLLLLASFAWMILVPGLFPGGLAIPLFIVGLAGFGVGVGIVYASALYYAMEVGHSGVDAGGAHESLIGLGYTVGPLCGLCGIEAAATELVGNDSATLVMLGVVSLIALTAGGIALSRAAHLVRQTGR